MLSTFPRRLTGAALVLTTLALSACAPAQTVAEPEATPAASPTAPAPSAAPILDVATLQFSGASVRALDIAGATVDEEQFGAGLDRTVVLVSESLGAEPVVAENEAQCAAANTSYQWDGLLLTAWSDGAGFVLSFSAAASGAVRLETTGGYAPGDDVSAFVATLPDSSVGRPGGADLYVAFDVVSTTTVGEYSSPVGAVGYLPDGATLQSVVTPGEWSSFLC